MTIGGSASSASETTDKLASSPAQTRGPRKSIVDPRSSPVNRRNTSPLFSVVAIGLPNSSVKRPPLPPHVGFFVQFRGVRKRVFPAAGGADAPTAKTLCRGQVAVARGRRCADRIFPFGGRLVVLALSRQFGNPARSLRRNFARSFNKRRLDPL